MLVEFHEWITRKYVEWRGDAIGNEKSITEFAAMIGVSQPLMSSWMKKGGKIPRSKKAIDALSKAFGLEVYDVLGLEQPDPLEELEAWLESLPEDEQAQAFDKLEEILFRRGWKKVE